MTTRNSAVAERERADQIIGRLDNDVDLRKDPVAALSDVDDNSGTSGDSDNEDVSGYGLGIGNPVPTPPIEEGGGDPTDPHPIGASDPEQVPPYAVGGGTKPRPNDKPTASDKHEPANW